MKQFKNKEFAELHEVFKREIKLQGKSPKTIDSRRRQIAEKVGASGVAELTKYAIQEGITSLE